MGDTLEILVWVGWCRSTASMEKGCTVPQLRRDTRLSSFQRTRWVTRRPIRNGPRRSHLRRDVEGRACAPECVFWEGARREGASWRSCGGTSVREVAESGVSKGGSERDRDGGELRRRTLAAHPAGCSSPRHLSSNFEIRFLESRWITTIDWIIYQIAKPQHDIDRRQHDMTLPGKEELLLRPFSSSLL